MKQLKDFKYMTFGITNQTGDNFYLPFFDYDSNDLLSIMIELEEIQKDYKLSNIYILKSTNGYNAFSLDKVSMNTLKSIYSESYLIDKTFVKWGLSRGFITLRMGEDKKLIHVLTSNSSTYVKSLPHKKFFSEVMNFDIEDSKCFDNKKLITISAFPSNKHGLPFKECKSWI